MYPFWDSVVWPILQTAGARRIVEIGALRGDTTVLMLERLGRRGRAARHRSGARVRPGRARSSGSRAATSSTATSATMCCRNFRAIDVALVDGDHNWFTVYHELKLLAEACAAGRRAAPGTDPARRRSGPTAAATSYYAPERIPEEFRQPYAQRGIRPGAQGSAAAGRVEPGALQRADRRRPAQRRDDRARRLRRRVRPSAAARRAARVLRAGDRGRGGASRRAARARRGARLAREQRGQGRLLELGERLRLQAMLFQHNDYYGHSAADRRDSPSATSTCSKRPLLDEHISITSCGSSYLADCVGERPPARTTREAAATRFARCRTDGNRSSSGAEPAGCRTRRREGS